MTIEVSDPRAQRETPPGERPGPLWFGVLAGPLAFLVNLQVMYMLVPWACTGGWRLGLWLFPPLMVALALAGVLVAWTSWRRVGREWPGEEGGPQPRSRFLATLGVLVSATMALVVVAHWLATFFISPCQRA
jgi:hypothetical protein